MKNAVLRFLALGIAIGAALSSCAELKTRYAGDPALSCGQKLEPQAFCTNFDAAPALRKDPNAQRARIHCLDFYGEAIRSTKLLCSYFEELDSLTEWGEGDDSPMVSAKGKRIHRRYKELAELRARELERAYTAVGGRGVRGAVEELAYDGRTALEAELACRPTEGRAPGLLLLGVSAQERHDEKLTYERLQAALELLAGATSLDLVRPFLAIRETLGVEHGEDGSRRSVDKLLATRLDEPALLALGMREVDPTPELERYYAEASRRAQVPRTTPAELREVSSGRGLASVHCPREAAP